MRGPATSSGGRGNRAFANVPEKTDVLDLARRKFMEPEAAKAGVLIAEIPGHKPVGISLVDAVSDYLEDINPS